MAIINQKVSTVYGGVDIASLGDRPNEDGLSAAQLKARFDLLPKEVVSKYNGLIDLLIALLENGSETNGHTHNIDNIVDGLTYKLYTLTERNKLNGIATGAEVNQNAFSSIKVGENTANANSKTDTFEIIPGLNIVALLNPTTKQITLSATGDISTLAVQSLITDIGEYYTSLNVEGALQEIGLALSNIYTKTEANLLIGNKVDKIVGKGLSTNDYDNTEKASVLNSKTLLENITSSTKEPTGFTNNDNITVSYNSVTRKITLNGSFKAYFRGVELTTLIDGWESIAHADVVGNYYLKFDGTNWTFDTTPWTFDLLMVAFVQYNSHKIAIREVHGLMPYGTHQVLHDSIGAYKISGGDFSNYVLNSTTATNRRPQVSATVINDEDLRSTLNALTTNSYTQRFLSGLAVRSFNTAQSEIIANNGSLPYWNENVGGTWQQTLFSDNQYGAIFIVAVPMTSDAGSQIYRYMFVQPQQVSTDLAIIQAVTPSNLTHGDSANLLSEFVFIGKIIIKASATNWVIDSVSKLEGTKISQVATQSWFLSVVTTDATLSGNGTVASPLHVVNDDWNSINATLTYASADSPTFVANTSIDLTSIISVGMKLKLTQTTVKYFIVTAITSTTITLYGGTDYTLANETITLPYFSSMKAPFGFPLDREKWTVAVSFGTNVAQSSPVANTWYNLNSALISVPIGKWIIEYFTIAQSGAGTSQDRYLNVTLSNANNTQSNAAYSNQFAQPACTFSRFPFNKFINYSTSSKITLYLNTMSNTNSDSLSNLNTESPTIIKAVCAYL